MPVRRRFIGRPQILRWMNSLANSAKQKPEYLRPRRSALRWQGDGKMRFSQAETPRIRKIALRSAMRMSPDTGGVFDALLRLVRIGLGGRFGTSPPYVSWIHERDFAGAVEFLIANEHISGAVNVSAPNPVRKTEFMTILREAWGTTVGLPSSKCLLEFGALFRRTEAELILNSRRVVPGRPSRQGFTFEFPQWREAARDLVSSWQKQRRGGA